MYAGYLMGEFNFNIECSLYWKLFVNVYTESGKKLYIRFWK